MLSATAGEATTRPVTVQIDTASRNATKIENAIRFIAPLLVRRHTYNCRENYKPKNKEYVDTLIEHFLKSQVDRNQ